VPDSSNVDGLAEGETLGEVLADGLDDGEGEALGEPSALSDTLYSNILLASSGTRIP
jgi:hypothetical protein